MTYKDAICHAAIAIYAAHPEVIPGSAVDRAEEIANELRIRAHLDSFDKNPDPVIFHKDP
jgi:hypothetical protein